MLITAERGDGMLNRPSFERREIPRVPLFKFAVKQLENRFTLAME